MSNKDYIIKVYVLGRIRHTFLIRAQDSECAERRAKDLMISEKKLTADEITFATLGISHFNKLDYEGFFTCF